MKLWILVIVKAGSVMAVDPYEDRDKAIKDAEEFAESEYDPDKDTVLVVEIIPPSQDGDIKQGLSSWVIWRAGEGLVKAANEAKDD